MSAPSTAPGTPASSLGATSVGSKKGKKTTKKSAVVKLPEDESTRLKQELQEKEAELTTRELALQQKLKEAQAEEKKLKALTEELRQKQTFVESHEQDVNGREEVIKQWAKERDQEWLAQTQGRMELFTKKERRAILIGVNKYKDPRIRDLGHSVEAIREVGNCLEQLNFKCEYLHDDLPEACLPTRPNILRAVSACRQRDEILLVLFVGHVVHGQLAPPRSSPPTRFLLPSCTSINFSTDNIITLPQMYALMTEDTVDVYDSKFKRKGILVVDGSFVGATQGSLSTGFAYVQSTSGAECGIEYKRTQNVLMVLRLCRVLQGAVNVNGQIPSCAAVTYLRNKLVAKENLSTYAFNSGDPSLDFPLANKLLKAKHELKAEKKASYAKKCRFTLTYTVNQDLDIRNTLLVKVVSEKLIDCCGHGVEVGKMELMGRTDIFCEGKIHYAATQDKAKLWRRTVDTLCGVPGIPFEIMAGESTRPGEEGRSAIVVSIETEREEIINRLRAKFSTSENFLGHACIDLRQHIRVTLHGTRQQFHKFNKAARRGLLDDSIFLFSGLQLEIYSVQRFNNLEDDNLRALVEEGTAVLIACSDKAKTYTKRNQALGRVADLEHIGSRIKFFFFDVVDMNMPNVNILPGPDISGHLRSNCLLLLDLKQARTYLALPGKNFFLAGFFPDSDLRELCEEL